MNDRGSASLLAVGLASVVSIAALVVLGVSGAMVVAEGAQVAADAAALAALSPSRSDGCSAAARVARRNGYDLAACTHDERRSAVTIRVAIDIPVLGEVTIERVAAAERSGPGARTPGWRR